MCNDHDKQSTEEPLLSTHLLDTDRGGGGDEDDEDDKDVERGPLLVTGIIERYYDASKQQTDGTLADLALE